VFETGERLIDETPYTNPEGKLGYYEYIFSPVFAPDGSVELVSGSTRDITERTLTKQRLAESEEQYRTLFNSIDEGFCIAEVLFDESDKAVDYRFLEVNPSFMKQSGLDDVVGKRVRGELVPDQEEFWFETYGRVARTGEPAKFEHFTEPLNKWFDVYAFRIGDPDDRKIALIFRDISDRKRAEEEIARLSERNREILESITESFFALDREWRFTYLNPQAEQMLERQDLIGKVIWNEFPGLLGSEFEAAYRRAASEGTSSTTTEYYPDHGRWYEVTTYPAQSGITVYFRNVTQRVAQEDALRESEQRYRALTELSPQMVWMLDAQGTVSYLSPIWEEYAGLTVESAAAQGWMDVLHPDERQEVGSFMTPYLERGEAYELPLRLRRRDGVYRWHLTRAVPLRNAEGAVEKWIGVSFDIDDAKRAEDALREADRRKDEFLATLAHELRNPLAPIRSGIDVLRGANGDEATRSRTIEMIERQTNQVVRLVDDLLDVSRITQGKIKLRKERFDLKEAVEMAVETSRQEIEQSGNELTVTLPYKPIFLEADLTRIAQVILNILNNAAKFSPPGGKIRLEVERTDTFAVISVKDQGRGIPPESLGKIFEIFGQLDSPERRDRGGLGIGLNVAKQLTEMHGGTVEARSDGVGRGSEFVIRLPLALEQAARVEPSVAPRPASVKGARKVLVVDDNHDAADMMETLLSLNGHDVRKAFDGFKAIELAIEFRPEVCLLDIGMPGMSGFELASSLKEIVPDSMLVSVSGWGQEQDHVRSREAGFHHHLVKPVEFKALLELIEPVS
jgi:PAS domain S-box-containing protein